MPLTLFSRRDPWWEVDGPAARRERRRRRFMGTAALATSLLAVAATALAWSIELGVASTIGIHARLPFG